MALTLLQTMTPALDFLDVARPAIDGVEVLKRITARLPQVPVVMVTAFSDNRTAARALEQSEGQRRTLLDSYAA